MRAKHLVVPTAVVTGFWADVAFPGAAAEAVRLGAKECLRRGIDIEDPAVIVRRLLDPLRSLHEAILSGDAAAAEVVAREIPRRLASKLQGQFRHAPREMILDAITDAIFSYLRMPSTFDSRRGVPLDGFLSVAARRNLANAVQSEGRRRDRDAAYAASRAPIVPPPDRSLFSSVVTKALDREPDAAVRMALRLWLDGDHGLDAWMEIPRFAGRSVTEVRREAKRIKDTFAARCKRVAGRWRTS